VFSAVELVDVSATVLDYLDLDPLPSSDGISLVKTLEGRGVARSSARSRLDRHPVRVAIRRPGIHYEFRQEGADTVSLFPEEGPSGEWSEGRFLQLKQHAWEIAGVDGTPTLDASDRATVGELAGGSERPPPP